MPFGFPSELFKMLMHWQALTRTLDIVLWHHLRLKYTLLCVLHTPWETTKCKELPEAKISKAIKGQTTQGTKCFFSGWKFCSEQINDEDGSKGCTKTLQTFKIKRKCELCENISSPLCCLPQISFTWQCPVIMQYLSKWYWDSGNSEENTLS